MIPQTLTVPATPESLPTVLNFITQTLDTTTCPPATQFAIEVAAEEIFVNIAHYAYAASPPPGQATITCQTTPNPPTITIRFTDTGTPYNPLKKPDPDLTQNSTDRPIGGLGIYMVKTTMDSVEYEYHNHQNILTIRKALT